ncbi:MAG TPA: dolichyl-phosphate beta-glucosyltransferase [Acidimicrobiales bacterium]|nr:dolichyl-phosphate beta-glucosyltransferase [Acidimicrobiales bacterium]
MTTTFGGRGPGAGRGAQTPGTCLRNWNWARHSGAWAQRRQENRSQLTTIETSIIVPAYNERHRLPRLLRAMTEAVDPLRCEIIVVDDGSSDGTAQLAEQLLGNTPNARVLSLSENGGKGQAVRHGVFVAKGHAVVFMDADHATDLACLPTLLDALHTADVAIGSRAHEGSVITGARALRTVMGRTFNRLIRSMTRLPIRDTQCGFKAFRAPVARLLFSLSTVDGFAFDVELLTQAVRFGFSVVEVPITWHHVEGSKVSRLFDPVRMSIDTFRVTRRRHSVEIPGVCVSGMFNGFLDDLHHDLPAHALTVPRGEDVEIFLPGDDEDAVNEIVDRLRNRGLTVHQMSQASEALVDSAWAADPRDGVRKGSAMPDPARDFTLTTRVRHAGRRVLRRGKYLLGNDPRYLPVLLRLTPLGTSRKLRDDTAVVVEGFPRSGNTFALFAMRQATENSVHIASHVHHPSQVKLAVAKGVPTMLVVREPIDALASYLIAGPHGRTRGVIKEYIAYHRELAPYADSILVCDFKEVTSDISAVIERLNERFGTDFPPFAHTPENVERAFREIETHHHQVHPEDTRDSGIPRPSERRSDLNARYRAQLQQPRYAALMAEAYRLYEYFREL